MGLVVNTAPTFKTISGNEARTALECTAPARQSAVVQVVEVTLNNEPAVNGELAAHCLTSDSAEYHFYDPAAVQATGIFPLGGPSRGGTLVTLSGSGFYDQGFAVDAGAAVDVALMFNADLTRRLAWIETSVVFSYEDATTRVDATLPVAGPSSGGSLLNVSVVFSYEDATTRVDA